jgi:heat shock protein HtpX
MIFKTIGVRTSLWSNNLKSVLMLLVLPAVLGALIWSIMFYLFEEPQNASIGLVFGILLCSIWFFIAFVFQEKFTMAMAGAHLIDRKTYPDLYNLLENLSITAGIKMPKLYMIESKALNAFASGIQIHKASICVTQGLVESLSKDELEAVLAHEISHILHRDMRLMTIVILFVSIIAFLSEMVFRYFGRHKALDKKSGEKAIVALVLVFIVAIVGYFIALFSKFAISRKREFMADAGSVVLTKDKQAMISALKKISGHSEINETPSDLRFMLFDNTQSYLGLLSTHPSIEQRIKALEKY